MKIITYFIDILYIFYTLFFVWFLKVFMRFFDVFCLALKHGKKLGTAHGDRFKVEDIDSETLKTLGAEALILDHDGVLGPNFSARPDAEGEKLIRRMIEALPARHVFILTNSKRTRKERERAYKTFFPDVTFINAPRKPDPEGLFVASRISGVAIKKIAVIDDGILTGVLMAVSEGAIGIYANRRKLEETPKAFFVRMMTTGSQKLVALFCEFLSKFL